MLLAKLSKQLRRKRSCFRPKKKRQPSAIASAGAVPSQGLLCCHRSNFGASGADDLVGGAEDFWALFSGIASASKPLPRLIQFERFTSAERHQLIVALKAAFASKIQIEMTKPEAKRIIIRAIVEVLPLNPFRHSIVSLDNNEKSIGYRQSALRTDHRFAGFIHF
jgi:hypothetical protein